jgi:hypothetical protein
MPIRQMSPSDAVNHATMAMDQLGERRFIPLGGKLREQVTVGRSVAASTTQLLD